MCGHLCDSSRVLESQVLICHDHVPRHSTLEDSPAPTSDQDIICIPLHHTTIFFLLSQSSYILIMATNTKYHAAPQRDSFEERSYTQAPPSYQAAGPSDGILGSPRGEDDNVPDDFKVRPSNPTPNLSASHGMVPNTSTSSSAGPSPKLHLTSACNSSAKSTPS
jgi:hypothetical protein